LAQVKTTSTFSNRQLPIAVTFRFLQLCEHKKEASLWPLTAADVLKTNDPKKNKKQTIESRKITSWFGKKIK
jgi:hypothetical protein